MRLKIKTITKLLGLVAALAFIPGLSLAVEVTPADTTLYGVKVDTSGDVWVLLEELDTCPDNTWMKLSPPDGTELTKNRMLATAMLAQMTNASASVTYDTDDCIITQISAASTN